MSRPRAGEGSPTVGEEPGARRRPTAPRRGEVVRGVSSELEAAGLDDPRLEAERLIASALGLSRADLARSSTEPIHPEQARAVAAAVSRRLGGEPLQHIEGEAEFRRLRLVSDRRALIPRPETEQLVDHVEAWVRTRAPVGRALDVGTGSGAIALALLDEGLADSVIGLDVSPEALDQARENAASVGLSGSRLDLRPCPVSIWPALAPAERFDLIVANLPYVTDAELAGLPPVVRDHEPERALAGGTDGLDAIRALLAEAGRRLNPGGALFLEIGAGQGAAVRRLLEEADRLEGARIERDLAGRERFAIAYRATGGAAD